MNRRRFLGLLAAAAPVLALDPERLLWVPGAKTFFLPPPPPIEVPLTLVEHFSVDVQWDEMRLGSLSPGAIRQAVKELADEIDRKALDAYREAWGQGGERWVYEQGMYQPIEPLPHDFPVAPRRVMITSNPAPQSFRLSKKLWLGDYGS